MNAEAKYIDVKNVVVLIADDVLDAHNETIDVSGINFPERVAIRANFEGAPIGFAMLRKDGNRVIADVHIQADMLDLIPETHGKIWDKTIQKLDSGVTIIKITKAEIDGLGVGVDNADSRIKSIREQMNENPEPLA